ncbi:H3 [[Eubacterium] siraeum]|uniref:H3 n=1 Tax=[Eubacterium] siraeum TaxID=39492 RepID=A0A174ZL78_9FIRM|nr:H3 [[Eubacterium] siraeum]
MKSIRNKFVLIMIGCILICSFAISAIGILGIDNISNENSETIMKLQASTSAQSLEKLFSSVELAMNTCNDYAVSRFDSIEKFKNDPDTLERYNDSVGQLIKNVLNNTDAAISGYIRYNPELKLSSDGVFWVKDSEKIVAHQPTVIKAYDKDDAEHVAWYYEPLKAKKPVWIDPYINKNLNDIKMISYVIPLFDENKTAVGIIGMDIAMSRITAMVDEIKLYDTGYAFLCDSKGDMVYHNRYPNGMTLEEIKKNSLFTFIDDNYSGEQAGDVINIRNSEGEKRKLCAKFLSNGMAVVISVADKEIGRKRISVMIQDAFAVAVVLIVTSLLTFKFTSIIVKPIKHLTEVSKKIAAGDLDVEIECKTKDEIGVLASRYSDTVKMLKKYINKINKQAYTDAATDVGNKAAYHDAVQRIDKMSQHANGDYAIFVMDINYLKMYNDKYGHEFGDMLISDASAIIKRVFGDYNIYRIGGDEFTVIINSPGNDLCEQLVKRFKQEQELFNRNARHYELGVRIAVGYAVNDATDGDYADVFNRADRKMYLDKQEIKKTARATDYVDNR